MFDHLADYLRVLISEGVCPDGQRRARPKVEVARAIDISERQLRNLLKRSSDRPQRETFDGILKAFFGNDGTWSVGWRLAMVRAWETGATVEQAQEEPEPEPEFALAAPSIDAISIVDPARVPYHFHARDDTLETLVSLITGTSRRVAIYGPHGVGKTVLAAAFVERYGGSYRTVAWIDARTSQSCKDGFIDLGRRLGVITGATENPDVVTRVLAHLARHHEPSLIIYDDACSAADLHPYLPNGGCHVLITSNSPNWQSEAYPIELKSWSVDNGAAYLVRRLFGVDPIAAQDLSADLGGLPLALELVAAFCERRAMSLQTYRQRLAAAPLKDMITDEVRSPGYNRKIDAVFNLSIEAAVAEHAAAGALLEVSSVFPALQIAILRRGWTSMTTVAGATFDADALDAALAALRNHSLISVTVPSAPPSTPDHQILTVHPLICILALRRIVDHDRTSRARAALLAANLPARSFSPALEWSQQRALRLPIHHLLSIARDSVRSTDEFCLLQSRWALEPVLDNLRDTELWQINRRAWLQSNNRHKDVRDPLARAFAAAHSYRRRADYEPLVLASMQQIFGFCLWRYGKSHCASIVLDHSLRLRNLHLDPNHPDVAEAMSSVADCAEQRGRHADALAIRSRLVASRQDIWPRDTMDHVHVCTRLVRSHIYFGQIDLALPPLAHALLTEAALTEGDVQPMMRTFSALVDALKTDDRHVHLDALSKLIIVLAKTRSDKLETSAKARMQLGFALQHIGEEQAGRDIVFMAMAELPDPHAVRMHALMCLCRRPPYDDAPLRERELAVETMQQALLQAESLGQVGAMKAAAQRLSKRLFAIPGREDEATALAQRYGRD